MPRRADDTPVDAAYFQRKVAKGVSEKELQGWVISAAEANGWEWRHTADSRLQHLNGLPDLLLWKGEFLFWIELKRENGKLTIDHLSKAGTFVQGQEETIAGLRAAGQRVSHLSFDIL